MNKWMSVYHGSKQIVEVPPFGLSRKNNDFGLDFYCTGGCPMIERGGVFSCGSAPNAAGNPAGRARIITV